MSKPLLLFTALAVLLTGIGRAAELRVLTYNIHHGEGVDGKLDLERIAGVIKSVSPDLVALNEVDRGTERTDRVDQPAELAKLADMEPVFEKNIPYQGGEYGNAVLSRLPITRHENVHLPSMYEGEQRGMLVVEVTLPDGTPIYFAATHLDYRPADAERMKSAKLINQLFADKFADRPAVLAGDLNAVPDSEVLERFAEQWTAADTELTFPAQKPDKRIDYVLYRPADRWRVKEAGVLDEPVASDHRPVLVVLEMVE